MAGLCFGSLIVLAFAPLNLWPLAFLFIFPLVWASDPRTAATKRTALAVALGCYPAFLYEEAWTADVALAGFPFLAAFLALCPAAFVYILGRIRRTCPSLPLGIAAPLVWVGVEYFRGDLFLDGFAWFFAGHPLIAVPALAAPAAIGGAYLVSALVATIAGASADLASGRRLASGVAFGLAVLIWILPSLLRPAAAAGEPFRIGVVQTNVPQDNKLGWSPEDRLRDLETFISMTRELASQTPPPDVIAWPETMFPGYFLEPTSLEALEPLRARASRFVEVESLISRLVLQTQNDIGIDMVIGAKGYDNLRVNTTGPEPQFDDDGEFNSAFLLRHGRIHARYDKMRLTPFGEVMPYISEWPWLERQLLAVAARGMRFELSAGERPVPLEVRGVSLVTPICFEATVAQTCRRLARAGRTSPRGVVILNLTNDGWFGDSDLAREQHVLAARWRSVELGLPTVRAANTGISCVIGPDGVVQDALPPRTEDIAMFEVSPGRPSTIFAATGNLFARLMLGGAIILLVRSYIRGRRPSDQGNGPTPEPENR